MTSNLHTLVLLVSLWTFQNTLGHPCFFWKDALYFDGVCYQMSDKAGNWSVAEAACESQFGTLTDATTQNITTFLFNMVMLSARELDWWIARVPYGNQLMWSSKNASIQGQNIEANSLCQYISAANTKIELPSAKNDSCGETKHFICERYVGNPCVHLGMSGGEIYDGFCYYFKQNSESWDGAKNWCAALDANLTEFRQWETYDYFKTRLRDLSEIQITTPADNLTLTRDHDVTLVQYENKITFYLTTCGRATVYLYDNAALLPPDNVNCKVDPSVMCNLRTSGYNVLDFWIGNNGSVAIKTCKLNVTACVLLNQITLTNLDCTKRVFVQVTQNFVVTVGQGEFLTELHVINDAFVTPVTDMAMHTENSTGVWYFSRNFYDPFVFLGATEELPTQTSRLFKWISNNDNVAIHDWLPGEPSTNSEHYLTWMVKRDVNRTIGFNDKDDKFAWPFCYKNALIYKYLVVLPRHGADKNSSLRLVVSSARLDMAYLFFNLMSNTTHSVTERMDWVNLNRQWSFDVDTEIQIIKGVSTSFVVLSSSHDVTVTAYRRQRDEDFPVVTFPNNIPGRDYCVSVNESCTVDYFTVTALENKTEVTFAFRDASWLRQFTNLEGISCTNDTAHVTLGYLETLHIDGGVKKDTGIAVHASDKVAVYVWTNCTRSQVELLQPESKEASSFRCLKTKLRCTCRCDSSRSLALAKQQAKSIQRHLLVPVSATGAYTRTKVSQPDARPSSYGLAGLGIAILVLAWTIISLADIVKISFYIYRKVKIGNGNAISPNENMNINENQNQQSQKF